MILNFNCSTQIRTGSLTLKMTLTLPITQAIAFVTGLDCQHITLESLIHGSTMQCLPLLSSQTSLLEQTGTEDQTFTTHTLQRLANPSLLQNLVLPFICSFWPTSLPSLLRGLESWQSSNRFGNSTSLTLNFQLRTQKSRQLVFSNL